MLTVDLSLMLNLTVDDHSRRLEKLEGALTRLEILGKYGSIQGLYMYMYMRV